MTSYHRSANFSVLPLREFACFVCLYVSCVQFVCLRLVVWNIHTTRRFFFLLPFRRNHLVPARNCEKRRRNKNTTFPQNNHWLRPTPKSTQSSWVLAGNFKGKLFDFNCFSVKKKKKNKNKIEAGLFGFQQVVPIRTYFLYHNLKKNQKKKLVFIRSSWDEKSSHGPFFSSEIASQVKQDLFLEFWLVGHHFEFWDRPKRKLESDDVAESDKRRRSQKGRHFRVSYFSLTAKNWERWGPHKVAGRCRLRKCPDTLGVYSYCLIWLERVSIIWFDVIFGIVWLYNQQQTVSKSPWSSLASDFRIHIWKIHADSFWVVDSTLHLISPAAPRSSDIDDTRPKTTSRIIFGSKYFELIFEFCAVWFFWREELVDQSIMWLTCWIFLCVLVVGRRGNSCCLMRQLRCCCCCLGLGPPCELMMNRTAAVLFCFLFWIVMALYGPASAQDGWDERELHF